MPVIPCSVNKMENKEEEEEVVVVIIVEWKFSSQKKTTTTKSTKNVCNTEPEHELSRVCVCVWCRNKNRKKRM